jgi:hypothetical protein
MAKLRKVKGAFLSDEKWIAKLTEMVGIHERDGSSDEREIGGLVREMGG